MNPSNDFSKQAIDTAIKIAAIAILAYWCFSILRPFILLVVWGGIIATALYPITILMHNRLGISKGKASALLSLIGVLLLLVPLITLSTGLYSSASDFIAGIQDGTLTVPKPKASIQEIPFVGEKLFAFINQAYVNLASVLVKYSDEVKAIVGQAASVLGSLGGGFVQFIVATIIAGAFMTNAEKCQKGVVRLGDKLTGNRGEELVSLSKNTVRSVVQGVIGVAVIQSILAGLGMMVAGVPAAAIWMLAVVIVAIIQLPPIIALLVPIIYLFSVESTVVASIFLVWCILVSASDAVLKPILLSRGSHIPMLVILLGALGGMAMSGIVGLFVGAVVLSLTYELMVAWLGGETIKDEPVNSADQTDRTDRTDR